MYPFIKRRPPLSSHYIQLHLFLLCYIYITYLIINKYNYKKKMRLYLFMTDTFYLYII